jgi:hypothetical protein
MAALYKPASEGPVGRDLGKFKVTASNNQDPMPLSIVGCGSHHRPWLFLEAGMLVCRSMLEGHHTIGARSSHVGLDGTAIKLFKAPVEGITAVNARRM